MAEITGTSRGSWSDTGAARPYIFNLRTFRQPCRGINTYNHPRLAVLVLLLEMETTNFNLHIRHLWLRAHRWKLAIESSTGRGRGRKKCRYTMQMRRVKPPARNEPRGHECNEMFLDKKVGKPISAILPRRNISLRFMHRCA